jgi:hypothetical protein
LGDFERWSLCEYSTYLAVTERNILRKILTFNQKTSLMCRERFSEDVRTS